MIGVDFGGAQIKAGIVDGSQVVRTTSASTVAGARPEELLDAMARLVLALDPKPPSVGVAIPGVVDQQGQCWRLPNVPGFRGVHLGKELTQRLGCMVAVENEATTAALGERLYGHGRRHPSFLMVTLGTGIGGGLVFGHQLYPGSYGFAAEVGHITVEREEDAWPCTCGLRGCLEAYAGTRGLLRSFCEEGGTATTVAEIIKNHGSGGRGGKTFNRMGAALGRGLANVQNVLDLSAIIFAGQVAQHFSWIEPSIRRELRRCTYATPLAEVPLLVSELGDGASLIGAAHLTTL